MNTLKIINHRKFFRPHLAGLEALLNRTLPINPSRNMVHSHCETYAYACDG